MKKLLLTLTLVVSSSFGFIQAYPEENAIPITVQNQLNEQAPQRWNNLSVLGKTRVYSANSILIPAITIYALSAILAPDPVTKGLEKLFGPFVKILEKQAKY